MKPTSAPLAAPSPPSVAFAKLTPAIGGKGKEIVEKEEKEEGEGLLSESKVDPPDQKGGGSTSPLIDLPVGKTPALAGKYVEMLDKEYGLVLNLETNELSIRIGEEMVKIPRMSEWIERSEEDEKDESGKK